jgi:hypothetical protein
VTASIGLRPDGSARSHVQVTVTNQAPPYNLPVPDPKVGYTTKYLGTFIGVFLPRRASLESTQVDSQPADLRTHRPTVTSVLNRKYVQTPFMLNYGESGTFDVNYHAQRAAEVLDSHTMVYRLDIDPQDLVNAELFHLTVTWPDGYRPTGSLPTGWKATKNGARFDGAITTQVAWEIPLTKG